NTIRNILKISWQKMVPASKNQISQYPKTKYKPTNINFSLPSFAMITSLHTLRYSPLSNPLF
ncbi:MAG: hypothetical protein M3M88_03735, partial [Thermoproteota archaeon]|nr:hypothetical protein [Thermoproteota archaeon]